MAECATLEGIANRSYQADGLAYPGRLTWLAIVVAIGLQGATIDQVETLWEHRSRGFVDVAVVMAGDRFSESRVTDLCRSFLAANRRAVLVRYLIVTDHQEALSNLRGPGITDIEFEGWRQFYLAQSPRVPATAELIRIRDRAIVRFRFRDGRVSERMLEGSDPLRLEFQGKSARILEIAPTVTTALPGESSNTIEFFIQTRSPWTLPTAEAFSRLFRSQLGLPRVLLTIDSGGWFVGEANYPIYNRFAPYLQPPTFEEFKKQHRFYCAAADGTCMQTGPARR